MLKDKVFIHNEQNNNIIINDNIQNNNKHTDNDISKNEDIFDDNLINDKKTIIILKEDLKRFTIRYYFTKQIN